MMDFLFEFKRSYRKRLTMNKSMKRTLFAVTASIVAISGFAAWDTQEVRKTGAVIKTFSGGSPFGLNREDQLADEKRAFHCLDMLSTSTDGTVTTRRPEWRECMLSAMPLSRTLLAAHAFVPSAAKWLKEHPDDSDFKAATNNLLAVARADLKQSEPWFSALENDNIARSNSFFYRLTDRSFLGYARFGPFVQMAQDISMMEFRIQAPDLYERQMAWLMIPPQLEKKERWTESSTAKNGRSDIRGH